jgi:NAD-dependent DNA ligase
MHAAGPQGPIPAADAVIDNLPRSSFDDKSLAASVYKDCPVCKDDFAAGDEYIRIPCAYVASCPRSLHVKRKRWYSRLGTSFTPTA